MMATIFRVPICPVCYAEFDGEEARPRILFNCGHVLCQGCLTQLYQHYSATSTTTFVCYKCKTHHRIEGDDKLMEQHFPLCTNILKMLERPNTFFECNHFDYLPEKRVCLDAACDQKNEFCVLCEQAIHYLCKSELIVKVDEFEKIVDLKEFEQLKLPADNFEKFKDFGKLLADAFERVNKILVEVKPNSVQEYLAKYKSIRSVFKDGKVILRFVEGDILNEIVAAVNACNQYSFSDLSQIAFKLLLLFAKMDLSVPSQSLFKFLTEFPYFIHNQELLQLLLKKPSVEELTASAVDFFRKEGLYKENQKLLKKLLVDDQISDSEIAGCKRQMNAELEKPFRQLLDFIDESVKASEPIKPENQLYLFEFAQYQKEVIPWTFDINFFNNKISSQRPILFTSRQRSKLLEYCLKNINDVPLDKKLKRLESVPMTKDQYSAMLKTIQKGELNSRTQLNEYVSTHLSLYELSFADYTEVYQKLRSKQSSAGNRFENMCRECQKYLWTKEEFESIKGALTENNDFKKFIKMMENNKVSMIPEKKFATLLLAEDFPQDQVSKCLKSANEYKATLEQRITGKKTLEELIAKKKRFAELLEGVRSSG